MLRGALGTLCSDGVGYSVMMPSGELRPTCPPLVQKLQYSVNQTAPSPAPVMPNGELERVGVPYSPATEPVVVT